MKKFFYLLSITTTLLACNQSTSSQNKKDSPEQKSSAADSVSDGKSSQPLSSIHLGNLFTLSDAEKILGEKAHLTDSSLTKKVDTLEYKSSYTANAKDPKTGKTGAVYFMIEQYARLSSAKEAYSFIKTANEKHEGVKTLHDMGDEAYFHSDGENFYFVLARKGDRMFRIKVNKITSTTSLDEFNLIAKNITAAL